MVDIWIIDTLGEARPPGARRILSDEEQRRARTLPDGPERASFIAARAALRLLLAPHCAELAHGAPLARGPGGKPHLAGGPRFNFSATTGFALVAISASGEVGVDVEQVRDMPFAARAFERMPALAGFADPPGRAGANPALRLLRAWTRFEASLKFAGKTLGSALSELPPPSIPVPGAPASPAVSDLPVRHGYLAACAHLAGDEVTLLEFDWDGAKK